MSLSFALLTSVADCDALLTTQQREYARLSHRLLQLDHQLSTWEDPAILEAHLAGTQQIVAAFEAGLAMMPAGRERLRCDNQRLRYALRLNRLLLRAENRGRRARLERELARAQVQASLALLDAFLTELQTHRAALQANQEPVRAHEQPEPPAPAAPAPRPAASGAAGTSKPPYPSTGRRVKKHGPGSRPPGTQAKRRRGRTMAGYAAGAAGPIPQVRPRRRAAGRSLKGAQRP